MPVFYAKLVNFIGYGEYVTKRRSGWTRDKYRLKLDGHSVTIRQLKRVRNINRNKARGTQIDSSRVSITKISSFDEGIAFVDDLCWLLTFVTQSSVMAFEYGLGKRKTFHSVMGSCNAWRPPFGNGIGKISDFVTQAWPNYQKLKSTRPLTAFIHMIDASDLSGGLLEMKVTASLQCLESIKSYFALTEGTKFNIKESKKGQFLDDKGDEIHFEKLLKLALQDVGMTLPRSFPTIKALRNALVHRGFIRETDNVTRYIFGPLPPRAMHAAMFEVMEDVQDILREYIFRLLGYKGKFRAYKISEGHKTIA